MHKISKTKGYSLVEIVIYIGVLVSFTVIIVNMLVTISHSKEKLTASQRISNSGAVALDRMTREIHKAANINATSSVLGTSLGSLYLTGVESSVSYTVEFYVASSTLRIRENGIDKGPLTEKGVTVTSLIFRKIASSTDQAIKIDLGLSSGTSTSYKSEIFYTTALLRQSL